MSTVTIGMNRGCFRRLDTCGEADQQLVPIPLSAAHVPPQRRYTPVLFALDDLHLYYWDESDRPPINAGPRVKWGSGKRRRRRERGRRKQDPQMRGEQCK